LARSRKRQTSYTARAFTCSAIGPTIPAAAPPAAASSGGSALASSQRLERPIAVNLWRHLLGRLHRAPHLRQCQAQGAARRRIALRVPQQQRGQPGSAQGLKRAGVESNLRRLFTGRAI
jgi:hypothetical protein